MKRVYTEAQKAARRVWKRAWWERNKDLHRAIEKRWRDANPDKIAARKRRALYGLTPERYQELLNIQERKCAICKSTAPLCVDHNHDTGKVRGLLCHPCNLGLGKFGDSLKVLSAAKEYLAIHSGTDLV